MTSKALQIVIADDHKIVREGLKNLLERQPGVTVIGEASDGLMAVNLAAELAPQVIIMDISMPLLNGIEAARKILAHNPAIRIIALSMHADRRFVLETLKTGVKGYLLKDSAFEELALAIRTVLQDQIFLSATITDLVVKAFLQPGASAAPPSAFEILSPREREVLQQIAEGRNTKRIASRLGISAKTVETHRKQIMDKLDLHTVAELVRYAIREGLTEL